MLDRWFIDRRAAWSVELDAALTSFEAKCVIDAVADRAISVAPDLLPRFESDSDFFTVSPVWRRHDRPSDAYRGRIKGWDVWVDATLWPDSIYLGRPDA